MRYQKGLVDKFSKIFGVNFVFSECERIFSVKSVFFLQFLFVIATLYLMPSMFRETTGLNNVFFAIFTFQWMFPLFTEICINFEAFKKRNLERKIEVNFTKIEQNFNKNFGVIDLSEVSYVCHAFILKFLVLFTIRIIQIMFSNLLLSIATMFTELVCSASDYAFTFNVNLLKIHIKKYSIEITPQNIKKLKVHEDFSTFYKLSQLLCRRYSISLLLNIILNFVLIVIALYWIFIRIAFGRLKLESS